MRHEAPMAHHQLIFYIRELVTADPCAAPPKYLLAKNKVIGSETYGLAATTRPIDAAHFFTIEEAKKELAALPDYGKWEIVQISVRCPDVEGDAAATDPPAPARFLIGARVVEIIRLLGLAHRYFDHAMTPEAANRHYFERQAFDALEAAKKEIEALSARAAVEVNAAQDQFLGMPK